MNILKIAFKNLNRQKRRSILLLLAVAFAFLVVVFMDGMTAGALKSMTGEIAKVVGGHVYIIGAQKSIIALEDNKKAFIPALKTAIQKSGYASNITIGLCKTKYPLRQW